MVMFYKSHVSLEEAWGIMREAYEKEVFSYEPQIVELEISKAIGFTLASPVTARRNIPHYHASAVDGFALEAKHSFGATPAHPKKIDSQNHCWVNTGSYVPEPFNTVVMVEHVSYGKENSILLQEPIHSWENIRTIGEDVAKGSLIGRMYEKITPQEASLFLAAGVVSVKVFSPLRIAFIPTGEELVSPEACIDCSPPPGKVVDTNSLLVEKTLQEWGIFVHSFPPVRDDVREIERALLQALENSDIILIGAGTAKGKRDHTFSILQSMGTILFQGVRTKPGRPALLGVLKNTPIVGLPGFPMSTLVTLWGILYPLIMLVRQGNFDADTLWHTLFPGSKKKAFFLTPYSSSRGVLEWLRVRTVSIDDTLYAFPLRSGSSSLRSMAEADGIAILPEESYEFQKNDPFDIWLKKEDSPGGKILYQGSNDPGIDLIQGRISCYGGELLVRSSGSLGGLAALQRNEAHLAATHLVDPESGEYNNSFIVQFGLDHAYRSILYWRTQGIIVQTGNPLQIKSIEDFLRKEISIVNRQIGAGTRSLLDMLLKKHGMKSHDIKGYEHLSSGHVHGAAMIAGGEVQAMIGIKAAADVFQLDFIPLCEEPFEIIIPEKYMPHPGIQAFLKTTTDPEWRRAVETLGGYRWNS